MSEAKHSLARASAISSPSGAKVSAHMFSDRRKAVPPERSAYTFARVHETFHASSHHGFEKWAMSIFIVGNRRATASMWAARMFAISIGGISGSVPEKPR